MEKIQKYNLFNSERKRSIPQKGKDNSKAFLLPYLDEKFFISAQSQTRPQIINRSPSMNPAQSVFLNEQFSNYLKKHLEEGVYKPLYRKEREPTPSISYSKTIESFRGAVDKQIKLPVSLKERSESKHQILKTTTATLWNALNQIKSEPKNSRSKISGPEEHHAETDLENLKVAPKKNLEKHKKQNSTDSKNERDVNKSAAQKEIDKLKHFSEQSLSVSSLQKFNENNTRTDVSYSPRIESRITQSVEESFTPSKTNYSPLKISARYRKELKGLQVNQTMQNKMRYLSSFLPPMREEVKKRSDYFASKIKWEEKYLVKIKFPAEAEDKSKYENVKSLHD